MNNAPPALVWHSSFASYTGYSGSALRFVLGLDERGAQVRPLYLYGADYDEQLATGRMHPRISELQRQPVRFDLPQVVYAPADRFSKNSGRYRIGFTMLEADRLPADWVQQANQLDEIWTPSQWGADTFAASGIVRPIHVIPLGYDPTVFQPGPARNTLNDRTIFLSVFEWNLRKGWDVLLRAYRAAFGPTDPVLLLLKIDHRGPGNPLSELQQALGSAAPAVGLIYNQPLAATRMAELYQQADCFVLPTHGEGWGMPILEAMACGVPALTTNWSAPTSFLTAANGYPLPVRSLVSADQGGQYTRGAQWAEPDHDALVDLLRQIAHSPEQRRQRGQQAAHDARQWTWERAVDAVWERVTALDASR